MTVVLSSEASEQLTELFDYLETNFSPRVRKKFQTRLDRYISAIKLLSNGFPVSNTFPDCRRCVVSPQTSLIYRQREDIIEIVAGVVKWGGFV